MIPGGEDEKFALASRAQLHPERSAAPVSPSRRTILTPHISLNSQTHFTRQQTVPFNGGPLPLIQKGKKWKLQRTYSPKTVKNQ
jgi:hypothetical protein